HRADADGGRDRRHEHHLDVPDCHSRAGAKALARTSGCRPAGRLGHRGTWYRGCRRPLTKETRRMTEHKLGTREDWLTARAQLLVREKELTRLGDDIAQQRRELPWVPLEKEYRLDTQDGERTLAELFDGRGQLIVYHFMFGPNYEAGGGTCSSTAGGFDSLRPHLGAPGPRGPRRHDDLHFARAAREAAGLPPADGLELQLGLQLRERLQLRLRCLRCRRRGARGPSTRGQRGRSVSPGERPGCPREP